MIYKYISIKVSLLIFSGTNQKHMVLPL